MEEGGRFDYFLVIANGIFKTYSASVRFRQALDLMKNISYPKFFAKILCLQALPKYTLQRGMSKC